MKKLSIIAPLILIVQLVFSQIPEVSPPSAAALNFGKYADIPVSPYTGTSNISIPIATVSEGPLSHSVSLNYHTGGNRVTDVASVAGLGWNLIAGGIITRTVRGLRDDFSQGNIEGYIDHGYNLSVNDRDDVILGKVDSEPDIYTYNFGGYAGKFVFQSYNNMGPKAHMIPKSDIKVTPILGLWGVIDGFVLTTPDGTKYHFGYLAPVSGGIEPSKEFSKVGSADRLANSWMLERIETQDGLHTIDFQYTRGGYQYDSWTPCFYQASFEDPCESQKVTTQIESSLLSKIETSTYDVEFFYNDRDDLEDLATVPGDPKKLYKIKLSDSSEEVCVEHHLTHSSFKDDHDGNGLQNDERRLQLTDVQKKSCANNTEFEPPYIFQYYGGSFFPHQLSKAMDHWGYYNGETDNDDLNSLMPYAVIDGVTSGGTAVRIAEFESMKLGALEKVTFPTGGTTTLNYEAHEYAHAGQMTENFLCESIPCSGGSVESDPSGVLVTTEIKNTGNIIVSFSNGIFGACMGATNATLKIYDVTGGANNLIYDDTFSSTPTLPWFGTGSVALSSITAVTVGRKYKFRLESAIQAYMGGNYTTAQGTAGGLRIQSTVVSDRNGNITTKSYKYVDGSMTSNTSSGTLYYKPVYGYSMTLNDETVYLFNSANFYALHTLQGNHIGYGEVYVTTGINNGYEKLEYLTESITLDTDYPIEPPLNKLYQGNQDMATIYSHGSMSPVSSEALVPENLDYTTIPGVKYVAQKIKYYNTNGSMVEEARVNTYTENTGIYRPMTKVSTLDNVTTTTSYQYGSNKHLFATKITNEKGVVDITYSADYNTVPDHNAAVKTAFDARHIVGVPVLTKHTFGPTQIGGSKPLFFMDNSTHPRVQHEQVYESNLQGAAEDDYHTVATYTYNSQGLVNSITNRGWAHPTTYSYYPNKSLKEKKYHNRKTTYSYHGGSNANAPTTSLLEKITAEDGTTSSYTYDGLMRLKTSSDDCSEINTTYTYLFAQQELNGVWQYVPGFNRITTTISYDNASADHVNSPTPDLSQYNKLDGLGRVIEQIRTGQAPNGGNILTKTNYDALGRIENTTDAGGHITTRTYEPSPLNRPMTTTPPGGIGKMTYGYGTNTLIFEGYPANSLYLKSITDADGNLTHTYTDKRGREVISQRFGGGVPHMTMAIYDDKDRLVTFIPPGASASTPELIYTYTHDNRDNVVEKKVPGAAAVKFRYNDRNHQVLYQDGHLRSLTNTDKNWYATAYDIFGRVTSDGFYMHGSTIIPSNVYSEYTVGSVNNLTSYVPYNLMDSEHGDGQVKNIWSRIVGETFIMGSFYTYDNCSRLTDLTQQTHLGSSEQLVSDFTFDAANRITKTELDPSSIVSSISNITQTTQYDGAGRPVRQKFALDKSSGPDIADAVISESVYDVEEQMTQRYLGGNITNHLQKVDYTYLNNGLLSGMNGTLEASDVFSYTIDYTTTYGGTTPSKFNGNIIHTTWQVNGGNKEIYNYNYDYLDRLSIATYTERTPGNAVVNDGLYNTDYQYDVRGNIAGLTREGMGNSPIDELTFNYPMTGATVTSNQLLSVDDAGTTKGYLKTNASIYMYDANGNLTRDPQKGITITYNHLDLVEDITWDIGGRVMDFVYDAGGRLLYKTLTEGGTLVERRDYLDQIELLNGTAESIYHETGRLAFVGTATQPTVNVGNLSSGHHRFNATQSVNGNGVVEGGSTTDVTFKAGNLVQLQSGFTLEPNSRFLARTEASPPSGWRHEYVISDHLGNTRMMIRDKNGQADIIQENNYYPFGLRREDSYSTPGSDMSYQFNGIEYQDDFDLNVNMATFRTLDPAIGRWWSVDPKAESLPGLSPYNSMNNNPISFNDPDGDFVPAAILGAGISLLTNGIGNVANGNGFFDGGLKAAVFGAYGGAASFGIGELTSGIGGFAGTAANIGAHATLGGLTSAAQGGNFGSGALSGAFGAASGIATGGNTLGGLAAGGLSGGVGSALGGGSFWQGVGQGLISSGLNHGAHSGAFGKNISAALRSGRVRHLFGPDAVGFGIDLDMFFAGGIGASYERVVMLRGVDAGKSAGVFDFGLGAGVDFSIAGQATDYYFFGSRQNIRLGSFTGFRHKLSLAGTAGIDIGGSVSVARLKRGFILGLSGSLGAGVPIPFSLSGNYTPGYSLAFRNGTFLYGDK